MAAPGSAYAAMREALAGAGYAVPHLARTAVAHDGAPTLDSFAATFQELSHVAVVLHQRLGEADPLHAVVRRALIDAEQAWLAFLLDGPERLRPEGDPGGPTPAMHRPDPAPSVAAARPVAVHAERSTELVTLPGLELIPRPPAAARHRHERAAIGRWLDGRRERGPRYPDEATIARWLRRRRQRGPRLPDEAVIARRLRERRQGASTP